MSEQTQDRSPNTSEYPTRSPGPGARLLLPLRLASRFLWGGDLADRVRALLTVAAIALSVAVILLTLAAFSALSHRDERADALTPAYVSSPWNPIFSSEQMPSVAELLQPTGRFWVDVQEEPYRGQPVTLVTVAPPAPAATIPPPPGFSVAPGPGEAVVSPALAELLATPAGADLRARLPQTIVGTLASDGLLDDGDLRAYVGIATPIDENKLELGYVATGWGDSSLPPELRPGATLRILLLTGIVVVITPLLVLIGLLGRLGGPARERRLSILRLLGAPSATTQAVAIGEATLLGLAGATVAAVAFPLITEVISGVPLDGVPLSPRTLTLSAPVLVLAALIVGAVTAVVGAGRTGSTAPTTSRQLGGYRPRWWKGLVILVAGLLLLGLGLTNGGLYSNSRMLVTLCAGLALTLLSVALLAAPAVTAAAQLLRGRNPLTTLAAARISADPRARAATVAGVGVVLAGAIALQAVLALVSADRTATSESTAPAYRVFLKPDQPQLTVGDITAVVDVLAAAPGAEEITGGFFLRGDFGAGMVINPDRTIDMSETVEVMVAPCRAIPERPDCRDGDVYRLDTQFLDGTSTADPSPGTLIRFDGSVGWTLPDITGTVEPDRMLRGGNLYNYLVTPGALGSLADLPASAAAIDLRVFGPASTETADHLRAELTRQGWQVNLDSTAEATGARGNLLAVGRAGLAGAAGLTVLAALVGLLVLTFAQVNRNRRAVALAVAAGWPRTTLRRSFVLEAAISAAAVVPIATAVAYGLAAVLTKLGRPATDLPSVGTTALLALGAALVTVLAAWLAAALAVRTVDVTDLRTG